MVVHILPQLVPLLLHTNLTRTYECVYFVGYENIADGGGSCARRSTCESHISIGKPVSLPPGSGVKDSAGMAGVDHVWQ